MSSRCFDRVRGSDTTGFFALPLRRHEAEGRCLRAQSHTDKTPQSNLVPGTVAEWDIKAEI